MARASLPLLDDGGPCLYEQFLANDGKYAQS